jgi:two-component sensor histidine kinase/PAS domain-containing protein
MTATTLTAVLLVTAGAVIMLVNVIKFMTVPNLIKNITVKGYPGLKRFFIFHLILMIFFFLGYLVVLYAYGSNVHLIGALSVGIIFFLVAIFIFLGIVLQLKMLTSIKNNYEKVLKVSSELEEKHLQLTHEIEERNLSEAALRASEAFKFSPVETIVVDRDARIIKFNQAKVDSGDRLPELGSIMYKDYGSSHKIDMHTELLECIETGKIKTFEDMAYGDRFLKISIAPLPEGAIITSQDITREKRDREQIERSLKEKETLLQEIHHRVKNNMQIVSSLLRLQSQHVKDTETQEIFNACQNRINSMALIHTALYQSKNIASIDFKAYISRLMRQLILAYNQQDSSLDYSVDVQDIHLEIDKAIPCGLIISELISNSLKHAFPSSKKGLISVNMQGQKGKYTLTIKDNGIGFPKGMDFRKTGTLGLQLVTDLTTQLAGTIDMNTNSGTEFIIKF